MNLYEIVTMVIGLSWLVVLIGGQAYFSTLRLREPNRQQLRIYTVLSFTPIFIVVAVLTLGAAEALGILTISKVVGITVALIVVAHYRKLTHDAHIIGLLAGIGMLAGIAIFPV